MSFLNQSCRKFFLLNGLTIVLSFSRYFSVCSISSDRSLRQQLKRNITFSCLKNALWLFRKTVASVFHCHRISASNYYLFIMNRFLNFLHCLNLHLLHSSQIALHKSGIACTFLSPAVDINTFPFLTPFCY
jgi:hypothetical protein